MVVVSLKASTLKVTGALAALAVVVAAACWEGGFANNAVNSIGGVIVSNQTVTSAVDVSTNAKRVNFLKSLGWAVSGEPIEVIEVVIPTQFDEVYNKYNTIQRAQGYDLTQYKGARAKRWSYEIRNYPGGGTGVRANLLEYNGILIGGDISSVAINGFMRGLRATSAKTGITPEQADIVAETFKRNG